MTELIEAVARGLCSSDPQVRMGDAEHVVQQRVNVEWKYYLSTAQAALTAITDAGYRIVKDERGQDQRRPSYGVKFREIANVDAHISALPAAPGDEK